MLIQFENYIENFRATSSRISINKNSLNDYLILMLIIML